MVTRVGGEANADVPSPRAVALVEHLRAAADDLLAVIARIDSSTWAGVPSAGVWSPGKDAEHVADATAYHLWMVRLTLGHRVPARPVLERKVLTAQRSQPAVVELLRRQTEEIATLIQALGDEHLDRPPRPPRARLRTLAEFIDSVLVGHYHAHRLDIESKLRPE
jgi:uncharacterized damage-inducible protein DinB